ncbi:major facilitator superfamily domain-containing protein [Fusarium redolens]|uniref:Major facilitator superfamily domain-containing protein n=1 Tax=Fusarium redolens TaxID=48865 RepID=A0A9P9KMQ6_FUSRE|nr:major facilitator superfamily domain-containing protein [Fusarium redolens]KAH7259409.1 major facilitator superfamily domain-containing protein [Fusarium redolens]
MTSKSSEKPTVVHDPEPIDVFTKESLGIDIQVYETKFASLGRWAVVKTFWKALLFCMILNWAALNDGFQQQIPGNVIPMQAFINTMADTTINGKPAVSARVVSYWQGFAEMSKTLGMFTGGYFADKFGRKTALCGAIVILLGGSIAEITASGWKSWLGAAVLVRAGVGLAQSILVTYVSELAPFQIRGLMIGAYQLCLGIGQLISAIATQLITIHQPTKWRPLIATEFIFTGLLILMVWLVPESHIYYARKGEGDKAKKSMLTLYGNIDGYDVEHEYRVIQHGIEAERQLHLESKSSSFFEIFDKHNWRRTLAGCMGICSQWAAGAPIVFSYSTYFFAVAGLKDPFLVTIITGCFSMMLFNVGLGTTGFFKNPASDKAALGCLLLWVIAYGCSAGPIGFVAAGETSTPRLRAQTTSFNLGCYGIGFVVFQWTVSYMISPDAGNLGVKAVFVWAGLLVPTTILLWFFYPETYGRSYWELDELYARNIPAWRFKNTQTLVDESGGKNRALMSGRNGNTTD